MSSVFAETVRDLRKGAGFTQRQLAALAGCDHSYISKLERDRVGVPSQVFIRRLAAVLKADRVQLTLLSGQIPDAYEPLLSASILRASEAAGVAPRRLIGLLGQSDIEVHITPTRRGDLRQVRVIINYENPEV